MIILDAENVDDQHQATLYRTAESDPEASQYALINGESQPYDLVVKIYGYWA